tara:strand:- start:7165 stop:7734 length:570 start_codon:yes stop_codon:yes gene_type:complete
MEHIAERNCEVVGHGFSASRLITSKMDDNVETEVITESLDALEETTGIRPTGWFSPEGVESSRTPQLLAAAGIQYVFDWPNDEQPYAMTTPTGNLTSLPLFLEIDDEFALWHRRASLASWEDMIVSAARRLHSDGKDSARHLIFTLRPWLTGQPFRIRSLDRALAQVMSLDDVWPVHGSELNAAFNKLS